MRDGPQRRTQSRAAGCVPSEAAGQERRTSRVTAAASRVAVSAL